MQQLSVGRIVHYVSYGTPGGEYKSECRAAVITEVPAPLGPSLLSGGEVEWPDEQPVSLCVLNPSGIFFNECLRDEDERKGGTWHWPECIPDPTQQLAGTTDPRGGAA
jgi:hypothetical protein